MKQNIFVKLCFLIAITTINLGMINENTITYPPGYDTQSSGES